MLRENLYPQERNNGAFDKASQSPLHGKVVTYVRRTISPDDPNSIQFEHGVGMIVWDDAAYNGHRSYLGVIPGIAVKGAWTFDLESKNIEFPLVDDTHFFTPDDKLIPVRSHADYQTEHKARAVGTIPNTAIPATNGRGILSGNIYTNGSGKNGHD